MTHNDKSPEWGTAGYGNEDVTQNVICCLMSREQQNEAEFATSSTNTVQAIFHVEEESAE